MLKRRVKKSRRRVPRWRAVLGIFILVLLAAAAIFYRYATRPERLRAYAQHWLEELSGGEARIERVDFEPLRGLSLIGVTLAVPARDRFDPRDNSLGGRTLFHSSTLFLRLQPLSLLRGHVLVPEIVAVNPELTFVQRTSDGKDNWQTMLAHRRSGPPSKAPPKLPVIRLRNARLVQFRLGEHGRVGGGAQTVWADAQPLPDQPAVYDLRLTKLVPDEETREFRADVGRLQIDMVTLAVRGQLPAMRFDEMLFASTPQMLRWIDLLALRGLVHPEQIELGDKTRCVTLGLEDASLAIPMDETERDLPADHRYLRFDKIRGRIAFEAARTQIELQGSFHGAPFKLSGSTTLSADGPAGFDGLGMDLKLEAFGAQLPRDEPDRDLSESGFVRRWKHLRNFVNDFDGIGHADLLVHLRKAAEAGSRLECVEGELRPKDVSARYIHFPYRLNGLTGIVRFRPDGTETIDLKGLHGPSLVSVTGWEGGFKTQAGDLSIRGHDVVLDDDLRRCLDPEDQTLCERFGVQARMDLDVRLTRLDKPPGTPNNPWTTVIDAVFRDGSIRFDRFPYPLERLQGKMRIAGGGFQIEGLTARRQDAIVRVSGTARWSAKQDPEFDLQMEASAVPFDAVLAAALPPHAQEQYRKLSPSGRFDLAGRLRSRPAPQSVDYELAVHLLETRMSLPTGAELTHIDARLKIDPHQVDVESSRGRLGESPLTGKGWMMTGSGPRQFSLHVASDRLALDGDTRRALPASFQRFWDDFAPAGAARVDLRWTQGTLAHNPETRPSAEDPDYTLVVEPLGASATYEGFPLALTDLRGSFVVTPRGVEIRKMQARSADASIDFSGQVKPVGEDKHVRLAVQARRLRLDDSLRRALPLSVRRQWNTLRPRGEMDVDFENLEFMTDADSSPWQFKGQATMRGVGMEFGSALSDADGTIRGSGVVGDTMAVDADLSLQRVRIDGRLISDAVATLHRAKGDPIIRLQDLKARLYDGAVSGNAEINYGPSTPLFSVWLDARGVSLEGFMNAKRAAGEAPLRAKGVLDADLVLSGRFDDPPSRRGTGNVTIRQAQMFRIPLMLSILQVLNLTLDDNAFHDAVLHFLVDGQDLLLYEIDLRGKALSMVGAGTVNTVSETMDLSFLVGGPMRLPRIAGLTDLLEDVARELMEVHVEGTLDNPVYHAEVVRSLRKTLDGLLSLHRRATTRP